MCENHLIFIFGSLLTMKVYLELYDDLILSTFIFMCIETYENYGSICQSAVGRTSSGFTIHIHHNERRIHMLNVIRYSCTPSIRNRAHLFLSSQFFRYSYSLISLKSKHFFLEKR